MAIPTKPDNLANIIGYNADTSAIADTSTAELSYESGFPAKVKNALAPGGAPLQREDLNAIVKLLSAHIHYLQSGSLYEWDATLNYNKGAHILGSDGSEYVAQADSGPETEAGAQDPTADEGSTYWRAASGLYSSGSSGASGDNYTSIELAMVHSYYYSRPEALGSTQTSIIIPAYTSVAVGDRFLSTSEAVTLDTTDVRSAGTDCYVYAVLEDGKLAFKLSANSTVPENFDADTSRKIGGFHMLCADVGTISGHTLSGYTAGDVLPASVWDLKHRPYSSPEGMVYHEGKNLWVDIYLASWDGTQLVSVYNAATADGTSATPFHGEKFTEEFGKIGKRLPWRHEFMVFAKGSPEMTNISGSADPTTTGGHVDTASRRIISNIGCEDCTGVLRQWLEDNVEGGSYGSVSSGNHYLSGYSWNAAGTSAIPTYNSTVDGSTRMGDSYGLLRRLLGGASWSDGSSCGSRAVNAGAFPARVVADGGGRGVSEPLVGA